MGEVDIDARNAREYAQPVLSIARILGISLLLASIAGCPRELQPPPAAGAACTTTDDCNLGLTCGELRACVGGRCEEGHSIRVPCR